MGHEDLRTPILLGMDLFRTHLPFNELALQRLAGFVEQYTVVTVNSNSMENDLRLLYAGLLRTKYIRMFFNSIYS